MLIQPTTCMGIYHVALKKRVKNWERECIWGDSKIKEAFGNVPLKTDATKFLTQLIFLMASTNPIPSHFWTHVGTAIAD